MSDSALGGSGREQPGDIPASSGGDATDSAAQTRVRKSPNAFRTISEVADDLHIPQHVLRFWETRFPQVKPMKRGGGRRYYRPADIVLLRRISDLLYTQGYTIKGVQRLLREGGGQLSEDIPPATEDERSAAAAERVDLLADATPPLIPGLDLTMEAPPAQAPRAAAARRRAEPAAGSGGDSEAGSTRETARLRGVLSLVLIELEAIRRLLG